ncbi:type I restriction-modification system subunit M [Runella slithyformis]|uniref:site-specific DNA-methyltransferase (adenine-specific) n=2 Tax=Runella TaxID=105 RepID=A0A7U4E7J6_RUNSL|nr:type I restriction-modification system, M subunit [Runella slithyformis DSM 19594]
MSVDQKRQLEQQLWNIADTLRSESGMEADQYRDYILGFIFYKYLSEKMLLIANKILKDSGETVQYQDIDEATDEGKEYLEAIREETVESLGFFLKPSELFNTIAIRGQKSEQDDEEKDDEKKNDGFILGDLANILTNIEQSTAGTDSEDDFNKLFEDIDLTSSKLGRTEKDKNKLIAKVLGHLNKVDFEIENVESDILGDAYEYLIGQFASGAGKKAGEFYSPQQVSMVLAKIVTTGKTKLRSAYDPTTGSGSLLLRIAKEVKDVAYFFGQELKRTTYNLARMNMIMHGVHYSKFDIKLGNTLERPQHLGLRFEAIVANPPFSTQWSANALFLTDDRFSQYGKLAPSSKADFAFIQHMIYQLDDNGTMAVVMPHGVLFRGGAEGHIRQYLIEDCNYLDAVIGLPANIFYGTSIPTCILVFKKCRENPDDILFIDASQHFDKVKTQNVLSADHIEKIVTTYRERIAEEKYSYVAPLSEVKANDFNLNIPRYVDTFEEEGFINLEKVCDLLQIKLIESQNIDKKIFRLCEELNLPFPNGYNLSLLNQFKKGVMQLIFSQQLRFKDDDGADFEDWEEKSLGEVLMIGSGRDYKHLDKGDIPVFGTGGYMTSVNKFLHDGETVCIGRKGTIDKPMYFKGKIWTVDTLFFTHTFINTLPKFIYYIFQRINWKEYNEASGVPSLSKSTIEKISISLPSLPEQQKIAKFLTAIDEKIEKVGEQITSTETYKKGLLQQMFC